MTGDRHQLGDTSLLQGGIGIVELQRVGPGGKVGIAAAGEDMGTDPQIAFGLGRECSLAALDVEIGIGVDPGVIGCGVVRNEVEHEPQAARREPLAKNRQCFRSAQNRIDLVGLDGVRRATDVVIGEVGQCCLEFGSPGRRSARYRPPGRARLPDAHQPNPVEAPARDVVQHRTGNICQRDRPAPFPRQAVQPGPRVDLDKRCHSCSSAIMLATSALQPVWCEAPRPFPVSPSKYS